MFSSHFLSEITTGKRISRIYKYDQRNWPYPYPKTTFFIPKCYDTYIQTQRNSDSGTSVVSLDVESA